MHKPKLPKIIKSTQKMISKRSPEILTAIGVAGIFTTAVLAVKATPKALQMIEKETEAKGEPLTKKETVKAAWKCYIPAIVTGVSSAACVIGANSVNAKRNAALAAAYTLSETAFAEYKEKVVETIGKEQEQVVREAVIKDKLDKNPVKNSEIIMTGRGDDICYDALTGRYFKSDMDFLKKVENNINRKMRNENYISLNEFYTEIGLPTTKIGDNIGWNIDRGYIDLEFSAMLTEDGQPCLVLDYSVEPTYDYWR